MNVRELIKELSGLPEEYEITVVLSPMPNPDLPAELIDPNEEPEAMSAFVHTTGVDDKMKCVYIFGCAIPKDDSPGYSPGNN